MSHRQTSAINKLPPELLARIFSYLPAEPPRDIAACRLVNHAFGKHSSLFLLPRVVFARRLEALLKLCQVLRHPFFRLHVTELVYDGSTYSEATAGDRDQYLEDCERAPRNLGDEDWVERQSRVRNVRAQLASFCQSGLPTTSSSSLGVASGPSENEIVSRNVIQNPMTSMSTNSKAFYIGCNTSFPDYGQYYADQQWILQNGIDTSVLSAAFANLPRLHSVVSTDYRSLAREGESYDICCQRLFGKVLEPQHVGADGPGGITGDCLFFLLNVLAEMSSVRIHSLALGPHAFEYTGEDTIDLVDRNHPQNPRYLDISLLEDVHLGPSSKIHQVMEQLEQLRLALCYSGKRSGERHLNDKVRMLLEASAPRMRSLTLHMIYLFWGGVREVPKVFHSTHFDTFKSIVMPLHMPNLRSLSLRRWIFTAEELKAFLLAHAVTLRDLHLLGCLCGDDETRLAQWGGRTLALTGVELSGFLAALESRSPNPHGWKSVDQVQWSQMRSGLTEQEVRNLELVWLSGRENRVDRQYRDEIVPNDDWWKQPARK
jgi:hypothetical protein